MQHQKIVWIAFLDFRLRRFDIRDLELFIDGLDLFHFFISSCFIVIIWSTTVCRKTYKVPAKYKDIGLYENSYSVVADVKPTNFICLDKNWENYHSNNRNDV